jgi:uncharacterized protein YPO0396
MTQIGLDLDEATGESPDATAPGVPAPGQMRLARLQLHNWGTFDKRHDLPVPRSGLLLTGESGSGKSSILDALSAVLMKPGETRFNAAAQDGPAGDRDRTPMSYVRGAYRRHSDEATGEVRPGYLRESTTVSGIALTFENGQGRIVTALRVMHVAGRSAAAGDLRSAYLLFDRALELEEVLTLSGSGIDRRRLRRALTPLVAEETYPKFGVQLRRHTGIGSEDAQRLLHRTQSAKSLTSLDDLLRGFMLETPSTFTQADLAVEQFRALQDAHATVVDAREQIEALLPQRTHWEAHRAATAEQTRLTALRGSVDIYRYTMLAELSVRDRETHRAQLEAAAAALARADRAEADARDHERSTRQALDDRGGAALQVLESKIEAAEEHLERTSRAIGRLAALLERLGSPLPARAEDLATAHATARREQERIREQTARLAEGAGPVHVAREESSRRIAGTLSEIRSLQERRSNLPSHLVRVRDELAREAGESAASLPFVGELMDVRDESWQGAVERLLSGLSTTILVPERLYPSVAAAVDGRHWGTRVSYERVREHSRSRAEDSPRSTRTVLAVLQLAESPFRNWLRSRLATGFPHELVDDARELARHEKALSRAGQIKNGDRHVKDDRNRLDDRQRWVIGTDNAALLELLRAEHTAAQEELSRQEESLAGLERERRALAARDQDLVQLLTVSWDEIDREDAARRHDDLLAQRSALLADADLAQLQAAHQRATHELKEANTARDRARGAHQDAEHAVEGAASDLERARTELAGATLDPAHREEFERRVRTRRGIVDRTQLADVVSMINDDIRDDLDAARDTLRTSESALASARTLYLRRWAERSVNLVDDLDATEDFLAILRRLEADRLPEFEGSFRDMLRTQSQNNIGQLRADISHAIRDVQQRLAPVDESLRATPFDTERRTWLTLDAHQKLTEEVKDFLAELLEITQGAFGQDEEHFAAAEARFARMDTLLRRLGSAETADRSWRTRVLDTRRHVEFSARELDASGTTVDVYRGSDGRSGGQRQRLVTFCLAAALRYQLTETAEGMPPYGLVVLDEAFDKTDIHFTRAGLEVFRSFGFQLLLATPLKMLQTIEEYVGGAAVVANPSGRASSLAAVEFTTDHDAPVAAPDGPGADGRGADG